MSNLPFTPSPPESIFIRLYADSNPSERSSLLNQLGSLLPSMNWRGNIYIVGDNTPDLIDRYNQIIKIVSDYLHQQKLPTIYVHCFIYVKSSGENDWGKLLDLTKPFQQEAYDQQSEVRMLILPIIEPAEDTSAKDIITIADFFRSRLAKPSFYFQKKASLSPAAVIENDLRVYVNESDPGVENVIKQLWINHVFESILERVEADQMNLLEPCSRHLVMDETMPGFFPCFSLWEKGKSSDTTGLPSSIYCLQCISHACLSMETNLKANGKEEEGRQVFAASAIALSREGNLSEAISHTAKAFEYSTSDNDRAEALLCQGLCHQKLMNWNDAEKIFREGAQYSTDPSLFAYHRGNVQFARGNYVQAAMLYEEAMSVKSPDVSKEDVLFNLGTSYINLEQFPRARSYLSLIQLPSAPVRFYEGICNLGEGLLEPALEKFFQALDMVPDPADISRVHFYIGNCYKEMGLYDKAIEWLNEAIEADPEDYMNHNLLGFCYFQIKEHEKAIMAFNQALTINPGSAIDYASIGSNLRELGKYEEAIAMYKMALSLDPTLDFARENIAKLEG